jgi:hypothetical protein
MLFSNKSVIVACPPGMSPFQKKGREARISSPMEGFVLTVPFRRRIMATRY